MYDELMLQGQHYYRLKKYDQALSFINKALAEQPDNGYALYMRAACLCEGEEYQEALDSCRECNEAGYDPEDVHELFAVIYTELNDFVKAEEHLLETLRLNPRNASVFARYSWVMYKTGHIEKSEALMSEAMEIDPMDARVLELKLLIQESQGKTERWEEEFQNYYENADSEYNTLVIQGNHHLNKKQYKKARECYRQAFLMRPDNDELFEILNNLDKALSPLFFPTRIFWYVNPMLVWIGCIASIYLLRSLGFTSAAVILAGLYIIFAVYTWLVRPIYWLFHRKR